MTITLIFRLCVVILVTLGMYAVKLVAERPNVTKQMCTMHTPLLAVTLMHDLEDNPALAGLLYSRRKHSAKTPVCLSDICARTWHKSKLVKFENNGQLLIRW